MFKFQTFRVCFRRSSSTATSRETLLFENKDKTLIRASYFAIGCQTLFWSSLLMSAVEAPPKKGNEKLLGSKFLHDQWQVIGCTALATLFPVMLAYGASKRIKRVSLIQVLNKQQVVKIENFLPWRNTLYYEIAGMHCKIPAPTGELCDCADCDLNGFS